MDSRAGPGPAPGGPARWSTPTNGTGSSSTARASFNHVIYATSLPGVPRARDALPRGVRRGGLRGRLGLVGGAAHRRAAAPGARPRALAGVRELVPRAWRTCSSGSAAGPRGGDPPASVVLLSGDVHHAYLAEVGFPDGSDARAPVYQAVCSPLRNPLDSNERRDDPSSRCRAPARALARRARARRAKVGDPRTTWDIGDGPWFDNQVGGLVLRRAAGAHDARQGRGARRAGRAARARLRAAADALTVSVRTGPAGLDRYGPDVVSEQSTPADAQRAAREQLLLERIHERRRPARRATSSPRRCCRSRARSPAATPAAASRSTTSSRSPASGS